MKYLIAFVLFISVETSTAQRQRLKGERIHQSPVEIISMNTATGDGGNRWGGHQTRIVHTRDGVFTAYTTNGAGYLAREWHLAKRLSSNNWAVIAEGTAGREPVNLLASPDGTLHIVGWPEGSATIWSGKPRNDSIDMTKVSVPI